jgi:hypothetical protein
MPEDDDDLRNRDEPCPKGNGNKHKWIGDDAGDSWCEVCGEVLIDG